MEGPVVFDDVKAAFGDGFDESAAAATVGVAVIAVVLGLVEADDDDGAASCSLSDGILSSSRVGSSSLLSLFPRHRAPPRVMSASDGVIMQVMGL